MFNFSANHLLLLSRTEYPSYAVFLLRDLDTQRVYRLHDFTKAQLIRPNVAYCVAGKVNSADKLYLVIESVRPDTKHPQCSPVPVPVDGAEGSPIDSSTSLARPTRRSPRACFPGVAAVVCAYIPIGASNGVETGGNAVILFRAWGFAGTPPEGVLAMG